jgi:hypothetical protein
VVNSTMSVSGLSRCCFIGGGDNDGGDDNNGEGGDTTVPQMAIYSIDNSVWLTKLVLVVQAFLIDTLGVFLSVGASITISQDATTAVDDLYLGLLGNDIIKDSTGLIVPASGETVIDCGY